MVPFREGHRAPAAASRRPCGLLGPLFGLFFSGPAFLGVLLHGVIAGAILGAVAHAATGGRRDFASATRMDAESYELHVDDEVADEARRILDGGVQERESPA